MSSLSILDFCPFEKGYNAQTNVNNFSFCSCFIYSILLLLIKENILEQMSLKLFLSFKIELIIN